MVVSKARPLELVHSNREVRAAAAAIRVEKVTNCARRDETWLRPRVPEVVWNVLCRLIVESKRASRSRGQVDRRRRLRIKSRPYLYLRANAPLPETRIEARERSRAQSR